jgi:hypothetical protein
MDRRERASDEREDRSVIEASQNGASTAVRLKQVINTAHREHGNAGECKYRQSERANAMVTSAAQQRPR